MLGTKANQSLPEAKAEETSEVASAQKFLSQFMEMTKSFLPDNNCTNLTKLVSFKTKKIRHCSDQTFTYAIFFYSAYWLLLLIKKKKKNTTQALRTDG